MSSRSLLAGAGLAVAGRAALERGLLAKFRRDVGALNRGDHGPLLAAYADDAVLRFHRGDHRWAGDWHGREGIDRFLRSLTAAGIQGEIRQLLTGGPPWATTFVVRFDDHADAPDGTRIYANRTVLVLRTRWGRVVEHEDFYADTDGIAQFDRRLTELGIGRAPRVD
jgi:ketosteroid isomerase-like protein